MKIYDDGHADDMAATMLEMARNSIGMDVPSFNASVWPDRLRRVAKICRMEADLKRERVDFQLTANRVFRVLAVIGFVTAALSAVISAITCQFSVMCPYLSLACAWIVVWIQSRHR